MRVLALLNLGLILLHVGACSDSSKDAPDEPDATSPSPDEPGDAGAPKGRPRDAGPQLLLDARVVLPREDAAVYGIRDSSWPMLDAQSAVPTPDAGAGNYQILIVDGKTVTTYFPKGLNPKQPVPLIFSLHGLSIPGAAMADVTQLGPLADREGFVATFPDGTSGTWNTGGSVCGLGAFVGNAADDIAYIQHIIVEIAKQQAIDESKVFVSGFSMGGYGSNEVGCQRPDLFRAIAPASGGFPTEPCGPAPLPAIIFHGTSDGTISYACGQGARDAWVAHNGCSTEVDTTMVMGGKCERNRGCPARGQVVFCSFDGMGHGWAGSIDPFAFGGPQFESATSLMWKFFQEQL